MRRLAALCLAVAIAWACRGKSSGETAKSEASAPPDNGAVPVRVAAVSRRSLGETLAAPGKIAAMAQQKIRSPFAGTLVELKVADGDVVHRGDALGAVVSRESEAALSGAREMAREAKTPAEKTDADRAVTLAERSLVRASLRCSSDGVVLGHAAAAGDRVTEEQEILTIADAASTVFIADVPQSEAARVRAGQTASVELAGRPRPLGGLVHAVLPGANPADYTVPVRVDLPGLETLPPVGLYGTARIAVGRRRDAVIVPDGAVLRDDVTGVARVAVVRTGKAKWIEVTTGLRAEGFTEILSPVLAPDEPVIVAGQVGLPEGAAVAVRP